MGGFGRGVGLSLRPGPQQWGSQEDRCHGAWSLANLGSLLPRQWLAVVLTGAGHRHIRDLTRLSSSWPPTSVPALGGRPGTWEGDLGPTLPLQNLRRSPSPQDPQSL